MFFELIAVLVAGFAGAGVALLLRKIPGLRLPGWIVPLGAGAAMLATTISSEMSWYTRTAEAMPEGFEVAHPVEARVWWRPWTYAVPMVERFVALDAANIRANDETDDLYMADLYFFGRWRPIQSLQVMVDCAGNRRADPFQADGGEPVWRDVSAEDPILQAVCRRV